MTLKKQPRQYPTPQQRQAMELIRQGKSAQQAMLEAGYSKWVAKMPGSHLLNTPGGRAIIQEQLDEYARVGITPKYLAKKSKEWLEATKVRSSLTEPDKIVPDYDTQMKAAELVRKDMGLAEAASTQNNIQVNVTPILGGKSKEDAA